MRRLKRQDVGPPDGFRYTDPDTGTTIQAVDYWTWVDKEIEHRRANGLTTSFDLSVKMEDQICDTIPPEYCEYEKEGRFSWTNIRLAIADVVTVSRALLDSARGNYVAQEEAERRAAICSRCYLNVPIYGCGACHQLGELVAKDRSTSLDSLLNSCAVCNCVNRAQVHIPLTTLSSHATSERQDQYPDFCWQKIGGLNYIEPQ